MTFLSRIMLLKSRAHFSTDGQRGGVANRLYQVMFSFQDARQRQTQWGPLAHERIPLLQKGATEDVVFALDVSKSMLVADMSPTRLARAKVAIANFIRRKGTGNVGLIAFSGQAFLQCPLTRDYDAFFRTLEETDTGSIQVAGTDIGRAIEEAELAFYSNRNRKLLIILTDGEDLESGGVEMAKKLKRKGLVVHAVGVGTPSGGPIRVIGETGSIETLKHAKKHLRSWMRPEKRRPNFPLGLLGARAQHIPRPSPLFICPGSRPWSPALNPYPAQPSARLRKAGSPLPVGRCRPARCPRSA